MSASTQTAATATTTSDTSTEPAPTLDFAEVEVFAGRVLDVVSDAATALTLSIGHRTGLFDTMAELPPSTSEQIAAAAALQERYVREWLGAMLVGGVVQHDPAAGTWSLPPEHAAVLTRRAGKDNLAKLAQFVGLLASVEHEVVTCFREGGGVPYSAYTEFHALMSEDSKDMAEGSPGRARSCLSSRGSPTDWPPGSVSPTSAAAAGHHLNVLANSYPASSFVGYDFSEAAITQARLERRGDEASRTSGSKCSTSPICPAPDRSTSSPPSTRSTTRPSRLPCCTGIADALTPGRRVPDGGHSRLQPPARERRRPRRPVHVRVLTAALHDRVAGPRRRRTGHGMGRADRGPHAPRGRLQQHQREPPRSRLRQQLLHRPPDRAFNLGCSPNASRPL